MEARNPLLFSLQATLDAFQTGGQRVPPQSHEALVPCSYFKPAENQFWLEQRGKKPKNIIPKSPEIL